MLLRHASNLFMIAVVLLLLSGCRPQPRGSVADGKNKPAEQEASAEDLLKSAIYQLRPENFNIAAARDKPVSLLNSWRQLSSAESSAKNAAAHGEKSPSETLGAGESIVIPDGWVEESERVRIQSEKFDDRDAMHIRDCMLAHAIANHLEQQSPTELGRIQRVVDYVNRNIALRSESDPSLPLPIYELLLTGKGAVEDRAWVASAILRQLRLDSVIVRPSSSAGADDDAWLFGVVLNDQIYLFDLKLGMAIPSSKELPGLDVPPATLAEVVSHEEWFKALSPRADQPYRLESESLKKPQVFPIVETRFWPSRLSRLEVVLPAEDTCILFDPPANSEDAGVVKRIVAACPSVDPSTVKPWPYPQQQAAATVRISQAMIQQIGVAMVGFNAPISIEQDKQTQQPFVGAPTRKLLRIRTDQLLGNVENAMSRYLSIRHLEIEPNPFPEVVAVHRVAAEDAIYWSGLCKFEMRDYDSAVEQLRGYVKRFSRQGRWTPAARTLLAECHARQKRFDEAIAVVEQSLPDDPYRDANTIKMNYWKGLKKE